MTPRHSPHFTLPDVHRQPVAVAFDAPDIVTDTGLLTVRALDQRLGYLADLARRLPDPRAQEFVTHPAAEILAQQVYQILADYPDCNDADALRTDPLFQTLAGADPRPDRPLACGSTLARFQYAFTRRQRELPEEDRPAFGEMYRARTDRIRILNDFLVETFIRTRARPPLFVILDVDPTDDPVHGNQALAGYHGYYRQHQYFPLLVLDGQRASRWRPGCGPAPSAAPAGRSPPWRTSSRRCGRPGRGCSSWCVGTAAWPGRPCTSSARHKGCCMPSDTPAMPCSSGAPSKLWPTCNCTTTGTAVASRTRSGSR